MIDGYDCRIRHMDDPIGILKSLENKGLLKDMVIILTADHRENLGKLGLYGEHGTADQFTCRGSASQLGSSARLRSRRGSSSMALAAQNGSPSRI